MESHEGANYTFRIPLDNAKQNFKSLPGLIVFGSAADAPDRSAWEVSVGSEMAASNENSTSRELVRFLIFGFIGGFILNLMPCVLPVISLKIFGFVQQAGQSRARIFRSGLAFIAGIFAWFLGLALVLVIIKSAGGQPVWAAQFTNPYFVLFMSAVVLVFALNLFGVFEINLPQWLSRRAVAAEGSMHGDAGSFFQAAADIDEAARHLESSHSPTPHSRFVGRARKDRDRERSAEEQPHSTERLSQIHSPIPRADANDDQMRCALHRRDVHVPGQVDDTPRSQIPCAPSVQILHAKVELHLDLARSDRDVDSTADGP